MIEDRILVTVGDAVTVGDLVRVGDLVDVRDFVAVRVLVAARCPDAATARVSPVNGPVIPPMLRSTQRIVRSKRCWVVCIGMLSDSAAGGRRGNGLRGGGTRAGLGRGLLYRLGRGVRDGVVEMHPNELAGELVRLQPLHQRVDKADPTNELVVETAKRATSENLQQ